MKFSDWITQKYLNWQLEQGERKTIEEFAAYVGVSRALMNMWMNGDKPRPGPENIKLLAEIFGPEIYDILNLPRPDPDLQTITYLWPRLPESARHAIREQAERYATDIQPPETEPRPAET